MKFFHFSVGERTRALNLVGVRKKRPTYLSLLNFVAFCIFCACLWFFVYGTAPLAGLGIGRAELEVVFLQSVSFLLVLCAVQMPAKGAAGWRPALLAMSFVALSESSLVALLTPIG